MADPLSITTGVIAITTLVIQSTRALIKLFDNIKNAPIEFGDIKRDIHAFHSIVVTLKTALGGDEFERVTAINDSLSMMVNNLVDPLQMCESIIQEFQGTLGGIPLDSPNSTKRVRSQMKWTSKTRKELRRLQGKLFETRTTLNGALAGVSMICGIRMLAINNHNTGKAAPEDVASFTAKTTLKALSTNHDLFGYQSQQHVTEHTAIALLHETYKALAADNVLVHRNVAKLYREIGRDRNEIQKLRIQIDHQHQASRIEANKVRRLLITKLTSNDQEVEIDSEATTTSSHDSTNTDLFFDCVSRLSTLSSTQSFENLHSNILGSPDYYFESSSNFMAHSYTTTTLLGDGMFVCGMIDNNDDRSMKFYLLYAETPNRWRRVILTVDCGTSWALLEPLAAGTTRSTMAVEIIPKTLRHLFCKLLSSLRLAHTISNVDVAVREGRWNNKEIISTRVTRNRYHPLKEITEPLLQALRLINCPIFMESQVVTISGDTASTYIAWVDNRAHWEHKLAFTTIERDEVVEFFEELRQLIYLYGAKGILGLTGIVLDSARRDIRSFLTELPAHGGLRSFIRNTGKDNTSIPWHIKEAWARQVVEVVAECHSRGVVMTIVELRSFTIRADGTIGFRTYRISQKKLNHRPGRVPPELRENDKHVQASCLGPFNFATDIFQLGSVLWLIAEQMSNEFGKFCVRAACTNFPRYMCIAPHADPVDLPYCNFNVPLYFNKTIKACRSENPEERLSANDLLQLFPPRSQNSDWSTASNELLETYAESREPPVWMCSECGFEITDFLYHCKICEGDDFDLCQPCYAMGVRCYQPGQHQLVKRVFEGGEMVEI